MYVYLHMSCMSGVSIQFDYPISYDEEMRVIRVKRETISLIHIAPLFRFGSYTHQHEFLLLLCIVELLLPALIQNCS